MKTSSQSFPDADAEGRRDHGLGGGLGLMLRQDLLPMGEHSAGAADSVENLDKW